MNQSCDGWTRSLGRAARGAWRTLASRALWRCAAWVSAALWITTPASAQEGRCSVEETQRELASARTAFAPGVLEALARSAFTVSAGRCTSIRTVLTLASGSRRQAGRKLEDLGLLDVAEARQEHAQAMARPEFVEVLKRELTGETDPLRSALIEAALLHDGGHFLARDLVLQNLRKGLTR